MAFKAGPTTRRAEGSRLHHYGDFKGIFPHYRGQPKTEGQWQNTVPAALKCTLQRLQLGMNSMRVHSVFKGIILLMEVKVLGISTAVIGSTKCWLFNISICNMTCSLFWKTAFKIFRTMHRRVLKKQSFSFLNISDNFGREKRQKWSTRVWFDIYHTESSISG